MGYSNQILTNDKGDVPISRVTPSEKGSKCWNLWFQTRTPLGSGTFPGQAHTQHRSELEEHGQWRETGFGAERQSSSAWPLPGVWAAWWRSSWPSPKHAGAGLRRGCPHSWLYPTPHILLLGRGGTIGLSPPFNSSRCRVLPDRLSLKKKKKKCKLLGRGYK